MKITSDFYLDAAIEISQKLNVKIRYATFDRLTHRVCIYRTESDPLATPESIIENVSRDGFHESCKKFGIKSLVF